MGEAGDCRTNHNAKKSTTTMEAWVVRASNSAAVICSIIVRYRNKCMVDGGDGSRRGKRDRCGRGTGEGHEDARVVA